MARVQRKFPRTDVKQEFIPGIPDDITLSSIVPKLKWEACNVLQLVTREWQHIVSSRGVYDRKVRSNATEPFLLLLFYQPHDKIVMNLYSCKDGSSRQLPPIVVPNVDFIDCMCLDGQIFVWVFTSTRNKRIDIPKRGTVCWTLDLVGDRHWTQQKTAEDYPKDWGYAVLERKIYRFRGGTNLLEQGMSIAYNDPKWSQTEVYDSQHDVWTFITPKSEPVSRNASDLFNQNVAGQLAADPVATDKEQSVCFLTTLATDNNSENVMATQVVYTREIYVQDTLYPVQDEYFFFSGAKLFKLIKKRLDSKNGRAKIQVYDTQKNKWEQWRLFSMKFDSMDEAGYSWHESECVSADNAVWATMMKLCVDGRRITSLVRSPKCLSEVSTELLTWLDTGYTLNQTDRVFPWCHSNIRNRKTESIIMRPIYL